MKLFKKMQRHAAIAAGDFASVFRNVQIPPLPQAAVRLVAEINQPEPDVDLLATIISSEPGFAAKVLRTANSSLFGFRSRVTSVPHAMVLLGIRETRTIVLSLAVLDALPKTDGKLFNHVGYWTDSVYRAVLAKSLAKQTHPGLDDDAFTATLLADVSIPVLLSSWHDYYAPIIERWSSGSDRLSDIERTEFGWTHAQASAWVLESWKFPEELICLVGLHTESLEALREVDLAESVALPVAVAALAPSVQRPDPDRVQRMFDLAEDALDISPPELKIHIRESLQTLTEQLQLFGISCDQAPNAVDQDDP